jgi:putative transposase
MPDHPNRKPTRLHGFNYAWAGGYFITLVSHEHQHLFGRIIDGKMNTSLIGEIAIQEWIHSGELRQNIELDFWVVMPNHFHAVVFIKDFPQKNTSEKFQRLPGSLSALVAGFKSSVTRKVNKIQNTQGFRVWQRNYYDHIIRDETDQNRIREYIVNNSLKWELDKEYSKD